MGDTSFGDALTAPFWEGTAQRELRIQRCTACGAHQFYPRPFCLGCDADVIWVTARGTGVVYSRTTVRIPVTPALEPPYVVALVEIDEGPRLLTVLTDPDLAIGDRVRVSWRQRGNGPPLPVFSPVDGDGKSGD